MSDSCCNTPIDTRALQGRQHRLLIVVLAINAGTFLMMVTAAMLSNSSVWLFASAWPDIIVATALLILFLRSALRVLGSAWRELQAVPLRS